MANRKQRRTAAKIADEFPPLPAIPNISGTDEACNNCRFCCDPERWRKIQHLQRIPATISDDVLCLHDPGGGRGMKSWGWCGKWKAKLNG